MRIWLQSASDPSHKISVETAISGAEWGVYGNGTTESGRGTFRSVKELVERIDQYVQTSNNHAQPFVWTATAGSIFAKYNDYVNVFPGRGTRT